MMGARSIMRVAVGQNFLAFDFIIDYLSIVLNSKFSIVIDVQLNFYLGLLYLLKLLLIIELRDVLMLQNLFDCYPFAWVEFKHFADQIKTTWANLASK